MVGTKKIFWTAVLIGQVISIGAFAQNRPARNPYLSAETYATTHFDSAQTDSFPYAVPKGNFKVDLDSVARIVHGPVNIMTLASTDSNFMWGSSSEGVSYIDVSNGGFKEVAFLKGPGSKNISSEKISNLLNQKFTSVAQVEKVASKDLGLDWTVLANGTYCTVGHDNVYYGNYGGKIIAVGLNDPKNPAAGIKILRSFDTASIVPKGELVVGVNMTYDGKLVLLSNRSVSVIDRSLAGTLSTIKLGADELVTNSMSIDEKGGIYIASDKNMYKFIWNGKNLTLNESEGAWKAPYDFGQQPPAVKLGIGTGSTPTLMGFGSDPDKLVVITDGSDHMKLVAFWRNEIPKGFKQIKGTKSARIAGQLPITAGLSPKPKFIQSEQSVVVNGYGAFVVNNVAEKGEKDKLVDVITLGPINKPATGVERAEWNPQTHSWRSVWTRNDVISISMVPAVSDASKIVFVNGYSKKDGWEITGMDWATGKTVHRTLFGHSIRGNGAYAIIQAFPNGDLLFNSILGPARVPLKEPMRPLSQLDN